MRDRSNSSSREPSQRSGGGGLMYKRQLFQRKKSCPFTGEGALAIDYKDVRLLSRFITERGKMIPKRISSVSSKKQRELSTAIKRARFLALLPFVNG